MEKIAQASQSLVTIIIPVYNAERYLTQCIDSVLSQTFPHWKLILVDDGSTDAGANICDRYARLNPDRVSVIHQPNAGVSAARNAGIKAATTPYIYFADADDSLHPKAIDILYNVAKTTDADIAIGGITTDPATKGNADTTKRYKTWSLSGIETMEHAMYQTPRIDKKTFLNGPWGKLIRREVFDGIAFRENLRYEDLDLMYRLYHRVNNVVAISLPLYFYRPNPEGFINTFTPQRLDALTVTAEMEDYVNQHLPALYPAARDRRLSAAFNMLILTSRAGMRDDADRCWDVIKERRFGSLINHKVRLKNRIACLLSYSGRWALLWISKIANYK